MGKGKNARRKSRLHEMSQLGDMEKLEFKMQFIKEIGKQWGRMPVFKRTRREAGLFEVTCGFQGIPYSVIGVKGEGQNHEAADANLAFNFLSFLENGYITKESVKVIRTKWSHATAEIIEIVNVFQFIEKYLSVSAYEELKNAKDEGHPYVKSLARSLKVRVKAALKRKDQGFMQPSTSQKRKHSDSVSDDNDKKKRKTDIGTTLRVADDDEIICLDDTGDLSLNVSCSPKREQNPEQCLEAWASLNPKDFFGGKQNFAEWCKDNSLPLDFERNLIGVEFCASPDLEDKVGKYIAKHKDAVEKLDKKIWTHYYRNGQSSQVYAWKMQVRELLLDHFNQLFPRKQIQMFAVGSTVNGCGSYNSDMDLCLCIPREGTTEDFSADRSAAIKVLRKINGAMANKHSLKKIVKRSDFVPAKVPIIKVEMNHPYEELDLDINVNNIAGIYNSHLIHYYSKFDTRFPSLALLIKHWAITNNVNDPMNGTLNSYSLILLVLHYLQCGVRPAVLPNLQYLFPKRFADMPPLSKLDLYQELIGIPERPLNNAKVSELLIGFFHYYHSFDFATYAISIRNGKRFSRVNMSADTHHYQMYLEEPFDGKNTARCVVKPHSMHAIKTAINKAYRQFSEKSPTLESIDVRV